MAPEVIFEIRDGNKPIVANEVTDFPEPDSPTMPRISFGKTEKFTW
jgi:hypothetical protein